MINLLTNLILFVSVPSRGLGGANSPYAYKGAGIVSFPSPREDWGGSNLSQIPHLTALLSVSVPSRGCGGF